MLCLSTGSFRRLRSSGPGGLPIDGMLSIWTACRPEAPFFSDGTAGGIMQVIILQLSKVLLHRRRREIVQLAQSERPVQAMRATDRVAIGLHLPCSSRTMFVQNNTGPCEVRKPQSILAE